MKMLVKDGVKYLPHDYEDEEELERMIIEHSELIFGDDSIFLSKRRVKAISGIAVVPDGFLLVIGNREWFVVEVEFASHPLHDHIVVQISKFGSVLKNPNERKKLVDAFFEEIRSNHTLRHKFDSLGIGTELYKFLSDVVSRNPRIIIVADKENQELREVCEALPSRPTVSVFETYSRDGIGLGVHIHCLDAVRGEAKTDGEEVDSSASGDKRMHFWRQLLEKGKTKTTFLASKVPNRRNYIGSGAGKSGLSWGYWITMRDGGVELYIDRGSDSTKTNKQIFDFFHAEKASIESDFGGTLEWERLDGKRACRISWVCSEAGLQDEDKWDSLQDKMIDAMIRFQKTLRNPIQRLSI